jgi:phage gpG-like protein
MAVFGVNIAYQVRGQDDEFATQKMALAFERTGEAMENFGEKFFPILTTMLEVEVGEQFGREGGGPNRGAWVPLSPGYEAWKQTHYPGKPILQRTGVMMDALTKDGGNSLRVENGNDFNFGTQGVEYASFHQTGTRGMPDRPPFDFSAGFEKDVQVAARQAAHEAMRDAGLEDFGTVGE